MKNLIIALSSLLALSAFADEVKTTETKTEVKADAHHAKAHKAAKKMKKEEKTAAAAAAATAAPAEDAAPAAEAAKK